MSTKDRNMRPHIAVMFMLFILTVTFCASSAEHSIVEIARPGRSTPWVSDNAVEHNAIIPLSSIPMLKGLAVKTDYYEIDPNVVESGYFYIYYVKGKVHDFIVESTVQLYRLLEELEILDTVADYDPITGYISGVRQDVKNIGRRVQKFTRKPKKAAGEEAGKAKGSIARTGASYGFLFKRIAPVGPDDKGEDRGALGSGPLGDERRRIAYAFGLDVYSDNPEVRELLMGMARSRTFIPTANLFSPSSLKNRIKRNDALEQYIRDLGPKSLRIEVGNELSKIFGMAWDTKNTDLGRFILNPNYTPRQVLYIGNALKEMATVKGMGMIIHSLAEVDSPELADYGYVCLRLYHILHSKVMKITRFIELEYAAAAIGQNGVFYFIFPGDVLSSTNVTPEEINEIVAEAAKNNAKKLKVLALGVVKQDILKALESRGINVFQNILSDPRFFSEEY